MPDAACSVLPSTESSIIMPTKATALATIATASRATEPGTTPKTRRASDKEARRQGDGGDEGGQGLACQDVNPADRGDLQAHQGAAGALGDDRQAEGRGDPDEAPDYALGEGYGVGVLGAGPLDADVDPV